MKLEDIVADDVIYWDKYTENYCIVVAARFADGACLICEVYDAVEEHDLTGKLIQTEACFLSPSKLLADVQIPKPDDFYALGA